MIKLIKNGDVYAPHYCGQSDILIIGTQIAAIGKNLEKPSGVGNVKVIDATDQFVFPGFIDGHLHTIGAGGSAGPRSRAREIPTASVIRAGLTTVVGSLGFDNTSRSLETLIMKAKGLRELGINSYLVTGSYIFPSPTVLGSIEKDIALIDEIVGLKMAVGESSCSFPTENEFIRNMAAAKRGALLGGKSGVVYMHMGDAGKDWFEAFLRIFDQTNIPSRQLVLMHVNRNKSLLKAATTYANGGGHIDFTSVISPPERPNAISVSDAVSFAWSEGVPNSSITVTSDGNASRILKDGRIVLTDVNALFHEITKIMKDEQKITEALELVTCNAANRLGLAKHKGTLSAGMDADILIVSRQFELTDMISMGKCLLRKNKILVEDNL